jgi:hypothetical protein
MKRFKRIVTVIVSTIISTHIYAIDDRWLSQIPDALKNRHGDVYALHGNIQALDKEERFSLDDFKKVLIELERLEGDDELNDAGSGDGFSGTKEDILFEVSENIYTEMFFCKREMYSLYGKLKKNVKLEDTEKNGLDSRLRTLEIIY